MTYYAFRRHSRAVSCCAGLLLLATISPVHAQLGQSELMTTGGPDAETSRLGAQTDWGASGVSPGKGWTPGQRFQKSTAGQQMQAAPAQMQYGGQDFPETDASGMGGWTDTPKRTYQQPGQSELITPAGGAGSAFQQRSTPPQPDWVLPSAQSEPTWQSGMQQQQQQQLAPHASPKQQLPTHQSAPNHAASNQNYGSLNGQVSENANMAFPATQFNPGNMGGGMNGMDGAMGGMGGGNPMAGGMGGMGGMGGGNPMAGGMGGMGGMGGGNPMAGGMGGMGGGMGALGALMGMGGMSGGAGGGSPMDAIGKAIAGAAQMGLIPGSNKQGQPNGPTQYGSQQSGGYPDASGGGFSQGGSYGGGGMQGGGFSNGNGGYNRPTAGKISQPRQSMSQTLNKVPGVQMGKQVTKSVNRGITRNLDYAVNTAARRGITRAIWGW